MNRIIKRTILIGWFILIAIGSFAQKITGNWKYLKAVPDIIIEGNRKDAAQIIGADIVSVYDDHTIRFTSGNKLIMYGESTLKYAIEDKRLVLTEIEENKEEDAEGANIGFSIKGDTLILESEIENCEDTYHTGRLVSLGIPDPGTVHVKKIMLKTYYVRVPDNYVIPKPQIADSNPDKRKQIETELRNNVIGSWKSLKMAPVIKTNNIFINFSVKALVEFLFDDAYFEGGWLARFTDKTYYTQGNSMPYIIKNETLCSFDQESHISVINDTLTMDIDFKKLEGIENRGDIVVEKAIARVYYVRVPESEYEDKYPYASADEMPQFEGGEKALEDFIRQTMKYPKKALAEKIERDVEVEVVVRRDGSLTDMMSTSGEQRLFYDETKRIIDLMPPWKPGKINGKTVPVRIRLTIKFKLSES